MAEVNQANQTAAGGVASAWTDIRDLVLLRRQLVEQELRSDVLTARRLGVLGGCGLGFSLTGLTVVVVMLLLQLGVSQQWSHYWWAVGVGAVLVLLGLAICGIAWTRFKRDFTGLRDSIAELKEDLLWLREWTEQNSTMPPDQTS